MIRTRRLASAAATALALGAGGGAWWATRLTPDTVSLAPAIVRVTSDSGISVHPTVAEAGNLIAYASDRGEGGDLDIWVQPLPTGRPVQITRSEADDHEPHFSPDGSRIVFRSERGPKSGMSEWEITCALSTEMGYEMSYEHPRQIMEEIARLTPTFAGVSYEKIDALGSIQWPCNEQAPEGTPVMHVDEFVRGKGYFVPTPYVATDERSNAKYPLLLTTGRILSQYNVGAQTRRTENLEYHDEDQLEIHPTDAELRGIVDGSWVGIKSRAGETVLRARVTDRVQPGVIYTTFHHPESGANVVTTDNSDWATDCPEYKVTAVQAYPVSHPSEWQEMFQRFNREQQDLLSAAREPIIATDK